MNDDKLINGCGGGMNDGYFDFSDEEDSFEKRKKSSRLG